MSDGERLNSGRYPHARMNPHEVVDDDVVAFMQPARHHAHAVVAERAYNHLLGQDGSVLLRDHHDFGCLIRADCSVRDQQLGLGRRCRHADCGELTRGDRHVVILKRCPGMHGPAAPVDFVVDKVERAGPAPGSFPVHAHLHFGMAGGAVSKGLLIGDVICLAHIEIEMYGIEGHDGRQWGRWRWIRSTAD